MRAWLIAIIVGVVCALSGGITMSIRYTSLPICNEYGANCVGGGSSDPFFYAGLFLVIIGIVIGGIGGGFIARNRRSRIRMTK
jgi:multisubunit Na+/H+ antiporter MnhB subunit